MTATALTPQEQLQARLSDPKILDALNRLLDRAELLAFGADALDGLVRRGDEITDSINDIVVETRNGSAPNEFMAMAGKLPQLARAGMHVADTVDKPEVAALLNSGLLEQLGKPETIEALKLVLSKIDMLAFAVEAVDGFLKRGDVITDNIAESMGDLHKLSASIDLDKWRNMAAEAPALLAKFRQISDSVYPATIKTLAAAGNVAAASYLEARATPPKPVKGVFELIGALKDPGVQRTLGFLVEFMKRYSEKMK